jgi:hypothetical protein
MVPKEFKGVWASVAAQLLLTILVVCSLVRAVKRETLHDSIKLNVDGTQNRQTQSNRRQSLNHVTVTDVMTGW